MKRKEFIIIIIVLVIVFAGITIVRKIGSATVNNSSDTETKPDSTQTFWTDYNLATQYRLQGKTDSSIYAYRQAILLKPGHKDAIYYLGIMYMQANDFENAHQSWEKLIEINPGSERAYNQLGNLYFCVTDKNLFRPEKARLYFEKANELNKESLNPNLRLAEIALFQNRTADAMTMFGKLAIMDQKNVEINFLTGYLLWKSGKEHEALSYFEKAVVQAKTSTPANGSVDQNKDCNLFIYWVNANLASFNTIDTRVAMPQVYKKIDTYLVKRRHELGQD